MRQKYFIPGIITILILSFIIARTDVEHAFGMKNNSLVFQTVPTRTPTPAPTNTSAPIPTKSNRGGGSSPTAVPTAQPLPTDTPTPIVTIAFTPSGGFIPTAESCGSQPTIQVQNPTNVRKGPGTNYPIVGQLVYLEVRFILGRAADAAWWLILLDDGATGWVADEVVTVQGYIGIIPIVPAPEINGQTPTPGTSWNPTPLPFCTVTPTATAVPSNTPGPTTAVSEFTPTPAVAEPATGASATTLLPQPTQTAVAPPTLPPPTATNQPEADPVLPAATPVEAAATGSTTDWLLPVAGLLLVAGGVATFAARRKK